MDHAEMVTKRVLEAVLAGASMDYRFTQSHGEYDFELRYPNGTIAAVEATSSVDQTQAQAIAEIHNKKKGGPTIRATRCKESWIIFPTKVSQITQIRREVDGYLSKLEHAGITTFSWSHDGPQCVHDICGDLKILRGSVIHAGAPPKICIASPGGGGAIGPSVAIDAGEREAWKHDNRKKLGAARTNERHLVVYFDVLNGLPWGALTDFRPPPDLPNIPSEITDIWLVCHGDKSDQFVAWHASANQGWRSMTVVCPG